MCCQIEFDFLKDIVLNGLNGFIGVILKDGVSVSLLIWQLKSSQKTTNFSNLLKLKELFNSDRNWNIYRYFLGEDVSIPSESEIYEYLGLYELAYEMRKHKQISNYEFFNMYSYRINTFANDETVIKIIANEPIAWEKLIELILVNNKWGYKNKRLDYKTYIRVKNLYIRFKSPKSEV